MLHTKLDEKCGLCELQAPKYQCPRCQVDYCSVVCYKSITHQACLNAFHERNMTELANFQEKKHSDLEKLKVIQTIQKFQNTSTDSTDRHASESWHYEPVIKLNLEDLDVTKKDLENNKMYDQDENLNEDLDYLVNNSETEELLKMLSPEQRTRFEEMLETQYANYEIIDGFKS